MFHIIKSIFEMEMFFDEEMGTWWWDMNLDIKNVHMEDMHMHKHLVA